MPTQSEKPLPERIAAYKQRSKESPWNEPHEASKIVPDLIAAYEAAVTERERLAHAQPPLSPDERARSRYWQRSAYDTAKVLGEKCDRIAALESELAEAHTALASLPTEPFRSIDERQLRLAERISNVNGMWRNDLRELADVKALLSTERECRETAEKYIRDIPALCKGDFTITTALHVREPIKQLWERTEKAEKERDEARRAILAFGNNPAGFDWAVLSQLDEQEEEINHLRSQQPQIIQGGPGVMLPRGKWFIVVSPCDNPPNMARWQAHRTYLSSLSADYDFLLPNHLHFAIQLPDSLPAAVPLKASKEPRK